MAHEPLSARSNWDEITIRDNYMFATVFRDPELCRELLQVILEVPIRKVVLVESEVARIPEIGSKGIRLDVYVADEAGTIYDVEMQNANEGNLAKRSRYYLSATDMDCIAPGVNYEDMRDSFVIFVCSFDPFGRGLPKYRITPHCREDGEEMLDGSTRVFINALAWEKCSDRRLSSFLHYLCGGTMEGDEFTRRVDDAVRLTRQRPEWRRDRMKLELYLAEQRALAMKEGKAEGMELGLAEGLERGLAEGREKGLAEGREEGLAEGRAEGREVGLAEGRAEGRKQERSAIAQLLCRLADQGRSDELATALVDEARLSQLLTEFGLSD